MQNLSDEAQLIQLSTDAGSVKTVAFGQFFMTRDAEDFSVGGRIGCREQTLPRNFLSSEPNGCIREGKELGRVLELNTNYHQGKPGIEIRIESLPGDTSQSRVRISNGLNKCVRDLTEKSRVSERRRDRFSKNGATRFTRVENRTAFSKGNRQAQRKGKIGTEFEFVSAVFYDPNTQGSLDSVYSK